MTKTRTHVRLELPEFLTPEQMEQFMCDPNYRAERRKTRLAKLAPVAGQTALRGYKRDWIYHEGLPVLKPIQLDPLLLKDIAAKTVATKPLTDKITKKYDILPNVTSARQYGSEHDRRFRQRIRQEETNPERIDLLLQGAERSLEHTKDNLQINLWLKANIARLRLAHTDSVLASLQSGAPIDEESAKQTGWAIADFGYCLRDKDSQGLLQRLNQDEFLAHVIEVTGEYIADEHPEALAENIELVRLSRQEQSKRAIYWGDRYEYAVEAHGQRLPDEELAMADDLDSLIATLYAGQSEDYLVA